MAAKWFLRHFSDGLVRSAPSDDDVAALEDAFPGTVITIEAHAGDRLARFIGEDSYSYVVAQIFTGGRTEADLQQVYDACVAALHFEIDPVPDSHA